MSASLIIAIDNAERGFEKRLRSRKLRQKAVKTRQSAGLSNGQHSGTLCRLKPTFIIILGLLLSINLFVGCATIDAVRKPTGGDAAAKSTTDNASGQPSVYYTAVAGLKLYSGPNASTAALAELPLHQKVFRYKIERGYAYVKVEGTGRMGWVDNAQLVWRLPAAVKKVETAPRLKEDKPESTSETDAGAEPKPKKRSVFEPY